MFAAFHQPTMKERKKKQHSRQFVFPGKNTQPSSIQPTNRPNIVMGREKLVLVGRISAVTTTHHRHFFAFTRKNINAHNQHNINDDDDDNDDVLCNDGRQQMSTTSKNTHRAEKTTSMRWAHVMLRCDALRCFALRAMLTSPLPSHVWHFVIAQTFV